MMDIPIWLKDNLKDYKCSHCEKTMIEENISGVGIRNSTKYEDKTVFFFEYHCKDCDSRLFVELDFMSVEDFVTAMVEQYADEIGINMDEMPSDTVEREPKGYRSKRKSGSRISTDEVNEFMNDLDNAHSWDDILLAIGFSKEEIEKNKLKDRKKR